MFTDSNHLAHEVGNDPVEGRPFEAETFLTSTQSAEILRSLGNHVEAELSKKQGIYLVWTDDKDKRGEIGPIPPLSLFQQENHQQSHQRRLGQLT